LSIDLAKAKAYVDSFVSKIEPSLAPGASLLPASVKDGKAYEAVVLCDVVRHLVEDEDYEPTLHGEPAITLRAKGGEIDKKHPHFVLTHPDRPTLEAFTDIEFTTMSYLIDRAPAPEGRSHYHELDVLVVEEGTAGRPTPEEIAIAVECKATAFEKWQLRAVLGVRRELGLLSEHKLTGFAKWPTATVPITPASCLMLYSTASSVVEYRHAASTYGVDLVHRPA
jgi:hypothetical protein